MKLRGNRDILTVEVFNENFGRVRVYLEKGVNQIGDGYYVTATKKNKHLAGFIDISGNEIIPLKEMELIEYFYTPGYKDICFGFKLPDTEFLEYFHVKKQNDGKYKIVMSTSPFDEVPLAVIQVKEDPNLWIFQTLSEHPEYAVYSPEKVRHLTNFFDEISFELDPNPYHYIYFCKYIYSDIDLANGSTERIIHTSICGFFDENGNFSSQIFETEGKLLYNSYGLGGNSLSNKYYDFILALRKKYLNQYNITEQEIDDVINELFNSPNMSEVPKVKVNSKTKIIEFRKKDK